MATRATWELDCDKCGRVYACGAHTKSSQTLIRRAARADGWHALAAGKTYCPGTCSTWSDNTPNGR